MRAGADFAIIALPKNYSHRHGIWNLFEFGAQRFRECLTYGFGTRDLFDRILLLGFEQFVASTQAPFSRQSRLDMKERSATNSRPSQAASPSTARISLPL